MREKVLMKNPKLEVCFIAPSPNQADVKTMRLSGKVKFMDDIALKARLLEERPFVNYPMLSHGASCECISKVPEAPVE
ncbi:MAG TPA: hypothetical protein VJJ51_03765 [Candidatus Methanoperedens sp.]|nr:hypothetical protein [Candidatus Methanoperedens sp.]